MFGWMNCGLVHCSSARRFIRFNLSYIRYGLWNLVIAIILFFVKACNFQILWCPKHWNVLHKLTDWFSIFLIFLIFSWKYAIQMIKSVKGIFFYETRQKKSLVFLAGKSNLNWPYSPALPQRPKFKYNFPAKVD